MGKYYEIKKLSQSFFNDYPLDQYPELLSKDNRPYLVLLILIDGLKFALPLHSNIKHPYCYKFRNALHKTFYNGGIDFEKAILIKNDEYIGENRLIAYDDFCEIEKKFYFIVSKFKRYLNGYYRILRNETSELFKNRYNFSTLNYFKEDLISIAINKNGRNDQI